MNEEALFHKVRSLLKKAESTDFDAEAQTFIEKAQELIMRHAIDEEKLWASDPSRQQHITTHDFHIKDRRQGAAEKRQILNSVARHNRCKMWYTPGASYSTVAGFPNDLLYVELLYASIITQMNMKIAIAMAMNDHVHPKTFQNEFMVVYANRIGQRLAEATRKAQATVQSDEQTTALVLADRSKAVNRWVDENVGGLGRGKTKTTHFKSHDAVRAGRRAADETDITGGKRGLRT